ncbi:MAG: hypothetical protein VYE77_07750 [Planctomycetota bacterium]|nr:hypothetical protein [Planctomycetota bacterium]
MMPSFSRVVFVVLLAALLAGCDNVGRIFDPTFDPGRGPSGPGTSNIEVPPVGGDVRDGRPLVREVYPKGGGWPESVPIVVEFSESVNQSSLQPSSPTAQDARLIVRAEGTQAAIPCAYDFLAGGKLLVLRPTAGLPNTPDPALGGSSAYEVVLLPEARDVDGLRFQGSEEEILATFTTDAPPEDEDGDILAVFPRNNQLNVPRDTQVLVVFTRVANIPSLTPQNLSLTTTFGNTVPTEIDVVLSTLGVPDARVVSLKYVGDLEPDEEHRINAEPGITFGSDGSLGLNGGTPYSRFTTSVLPTPIAVGLAPDSALINFDGKINRSNLTSLRLEVELPNGFAVEDKVVARIYGGDRAEIENPAELLYVEASADIVSTSDNLIEVDFTDKLGTLENPVLDEGEVTLVAQLRRGNVHSGMIQGSSDTELDTIAPQILSLGPPGSLTEQQVFTDLQHLTLYGVATEGLGAATLTYLPGEPTERAVSLFAGQASGEFVMEPLDLGVQPEPQSFSLDITDTAGNKVDGVATGEVFQRGYIADGVSTSMQVEVYDETTLLPLAGATVASEPDVPVLPAVGRVTGTTGADGRVVLTNVSGITKTTTVSLAGYDSVTVYNAPFSKLSLPLRPIGGATATLTGSVGFEPTVGVTVMVGSGSFADPIQLDSRTEISDPTSIPETPILPNRPTVVTGLGGIFPASLTPTFSFHGCNMCGFDLQTQSPPLRGVAAGEESEVGLLLSTAVVPFITTLSGPLGLPLSIVEDFDLAEGLDTENLVGGKPSVRLTMAMRGFPGQTLFGVGFSSPLTGAQYTLNGTYSQALHALVTPYPSSQWLVTEAVDTETRLSRVRSLVSTLQGFVIDPVNPPWIPTVTTPVGPVVGAPQVEVVDALQPGEFDSLGMLEIVAEDSAGQRWTIFAQDTDPLGTEEDFQFPDPTGMSVLPPGEWSIIAYSRLFIGAGPTVDDVILAERRREEVTLARSAPATVTVQ